MYPRSQNFRFLRSPGHPRPFPSVSLLLPLLIESFNHVAFIPRMLLVVGFGVVLGAFLWVWPIRWYLPLFVTTE